MTFRRLLAVALFPVLVSCGSGDPADPTPVPTPTPAPTPVPSATPRAFVCPLPSLPDHQMPCPKLNPRFHNEVNTAIDRVMETRPSLFNPNDNLGPGFWKVLDRQAYLRAVTTELNNQGLCTIISPEEIGVKNTNEFNEQWNVITGRDYIRRAYITTCIPSAF